MMLDAALALVARRWSVFPCRSQAKVPATARGCKDATDDTARITAWWTRHPDANIGVATGSRSGVWVLDLDGEQGVETMLDLSDGTWPATLTQRTPSGGYHLIFRDPRGLGNTARRLGSGLDTRGDGGYIVAAPSRLPNGGYEWVRELEPSLVPGWLLRLVRDLPAERPHVVVPEAPQRNLVRYVEVALDRECAELAGVPAGSGRNQQLNKAAWSLGQLVAGGVLDGETVYARLLQACVTNGLLGDDGERQCRKTIASGLSKGQEHPRRIA